MPVLFILGLVFSILYTHETRSSEKICVLMRQYNFIIYFAIYISFKCFQQNLFCVSYIFKCIFSNNIVCVYFDCFYMWQLYSHIYCIFCVLCELAYTFLSIILLLIYYSYVCICTSFVILIIVLDSIIIYK